jgi:hypothetical protein
LQHGRWRSPHATPIVGGVGPPERPVEVGEARSHPTSPARDTTPPAAVAAEIGAMRMRHRPRHPLARALARAARALERAYLAHGTRMAETGGFFLP